MMLNVGYADDDDDCSYLNKKHYYDVDRLLQVISHYFVYQISLDIAALT